MRRPVLLALSGLIASLLTVVVTATPASAEHTPLPSSVTLVGSLQQELGCADDWSPPCEQTLLEPVPGTDTWTGTFDVPAGGYEFKVALNGTWDESYGADGGTANIPLVLQHAVTLRFGYDHETHLVTVAPLDLPTDEITDADRALAGRSLRGPLTRERFYFVMEDRFANGDPSNDTGGIAGDRLAHGYDPTDKGFFHGGDLAGLTSRLGYLKGLGTTAIWLTPSFVNRPVQGTGAAVSAGYHGYWITDFTRIDPHFGTNAELRALVDAAHQRGMKVFFDIITNHTADVIDYQEKSYTYISKEAAPYVDASGTVFDDRDYAGGDTFPALDPDTSFPYTPVFPSEADRTVKVPAWLNDPVRYHNRGDSTFAGESSLYGDFFGLDDLFTEQPEVVEGMTDIYKTWVGFGIDGFRIDTVKHVNMEFWQSFAPAIRAEADRIGNPDFFSFGEVYDTDPQLTSSFTTSGKLDATLDFGFQNAGTAFAKGKPTTGLREFYASDDWYTDADSNAYSLPTFLGNHDMGRIGRFLDEEYDGAELLARDQLAHSLMYLTRGQPVVYYGDEQGFTGDGGDKDARQDMFPSQVASYNDDDLIGTDATTADANFDRSHPLYRRISALAALRQAYPALADGAQLHRFSSSRPGIFAVSRIAADERREFVVAFNNSAEPRTAQFATLTPYGGFHSVWPWRGRALRADEEARVTVTVPPLSTVVFRADRALRQRASAPEVGFRTPRAGGVVGGRAEISATPSEAGFHQVSFAWRPVGAADWTPLGTDDNAPYRLFHDVTGLARGTLVEYRTVLRDSSGNLSATSTHAIVGAPAPSGGGGGGGGGPVVQPGEVAMPGSHNGEIGCPGDWQPGCDQAQLTLDEIGQVWSGTVSIPAGSYEYKAAIDRSWDENYGAGGIQNGGNIPLDLPEARDVTFFYDHGTHWITTDVQDPIVTAPGSFQSELGCAGDWAPDCMRSWLKDPDGDGVYSLVVSGLPAGTYEVKAAHGRSWDENYGAGGVRDGGNIAFTVPGGSPDVVFTYELATHLLGVATREPEAVPDLSTTDAHWVSPGLVAWDVSEAAGRSYRLHWSRSGGLEVDDETIGGDSVPLTFDPLGLPAAVVAAHPELEGFEALRLRRQDRGLAWRIADAQLGVASYDPDGRLHDATGLELLRP